MIIRQEESTPIGDYWHDNGFEHLVENIKGIVDEFDADTDRLTFLVDELTAKLKSFKAHVKSIEKSWQKAVNKKNLESEIYRGN